VFNVRVFKAELKDQVYWGSLAVRERDRHNLTRPAALAEADRINSITKVMRDGTERRMYVATIVETRPHNSWRNPSHV